MACISENVTESPEWKKVVDKIGLSETVRDYMENSRLRSMEEIMDSKPELFPFYKKRATISGETIAQTAEEKEQVVEVYQGYSGVLDNREFNYFTLDEQEAKDYGEMVRKVSLDTGGFLKAFDNKDLYRDEEKNFKEFTGKTFDILDNSIQGLETQNEFFRFLKAKGYGGIDLTGWSDSQYIVSFYTVESSKSDIVETISLDELYKNDPEITTDDFRC